MVPQKHRTYITYNVIHEEYPDNLIKSGKMKKVDFRRDTAYLEKVFMSFSKIERKKGEDIVIYIRKLVDKYLWDGAAENFRGQCSQYSGLEIVFAYMAYYRNYNIQPEFEF